MVLHLCGLLNVAGKPDKSDPQSKRRAQSTYLHTALVQTNNQMMMRHTKTEKEQMRLTTDLWRRPLTAVLLSIESPLEGDREGQNLTSSTSTQEDKLSPRNQFYF